MKPSSPPPESSDDFVDVLCQIFGGLFTRPSYHRVGSEVIIPLLLMIPVAVCYAAYESLRRRARYREQRAFQDNKAAFLDALARLGTGTDDALLSERKALLDEFAETVRAVEQEAVKRLEEEQRERPGAAWLSPRAVARRRNDLRRRSETWIRWAEAVCEAVGRGAPLPQEPGARKRAGAPIRRLCRYSINPMPKADDVVAAFEAARGRGRVAEKIRCGSLLLDAEARVDSSLIRGTDGEIVGRKPGLRGWLEEVAPQLLKHYVTLMKYRRLAQSFREANEVGDPCPAALLLEDAVPAAVPDAMRRRLAAARENAKAFLASPAARTVQDFRQALARREWRRTA